MAVYFIFRLIILVRKSWWKTFRNLNELALRIRFIIKIWSIMCIFTEWKINIATMLLQFMTIQIVLKYITFASLQTFISEFCTYLAIQIQRRFRITYLLLNMLTKSICFRHTIHWNALSHSCLNVRLECIWCLSFFQWTCPTKMTILVFFSILFYSFSKQLNNKGELAHENKYCIELLYIENHTYSFHSSDRKQSHWINILLNYYQPYRIEIPELLREHRFLDSQYPHPEQK